MKPENYITVCGWMVTDLNLSGNDLLVYALIYGFSQDTNSVFSGTARYIADWLNVRKETVLQILKRLTDKGLLEKRGKTVNGVQLYDYVAVVSNDTPVRNPHRGGEKSSPGGGEKSSPYIDNTNIDKLKKEIITPKSPYGEFGKVMLTDEEYERALAKYDGDQDKLDFAVSILDTYLAQDKKRERKYTSHYAVLTPKSSWVRREVDERYIPRRRIEHIDDEVIKVF